MLVLPVAPLVLVRIGGVGCDSGLESDTLILALNLLLAQNKAHHRHFLEKLSIKHVLNVAELNKIKHTNFGNEIGSDRRRRRRRRSVDKKRKWIFHNFCPKQGV